MQPLRLRLGLLQRTRAPTPRFTRVLPRQSPTTSPFSNPTTTSAPFSTLNTRLAAPAKHTQDKDSLDPTPSETSKSGGDYAAAHEDEAFDPSKTGPEETRDSAGDGKGAPDSTLDVSPGNPEVSKPRPQGEGGAQRSENEAKGERKASGGGSPAKGKKVR